MALLNGKEYPLNPAIRVIELEVMPNGDVLHRIQVEVELKFLT